MYSRYGTIVDLGHKNCYLIRINDWMRRASGEKIFEDVTIMTEKDEKLAIENLGEAAGGHSIFRYDPDNEQDLIDYGKAIRTPKYCCPKCGRKT